MYKILILLVSIFSFIYADKSIYVGDKACISCHAKEVKEWKSSHHALAMMDANEKSVQGNFNNTKFNYNGIITTFFKKGDKFMVNTDSEDGSLKDYEISYTFGIYPLQQYMIKFPKGNIQVLDIAWDNRPKKEGGQNWYHLHKDDNITAGDILHWTGQNLNWNFMCADCHSTNLKKNYELSTKSYHTTYDSMNVSCESCHGPASRHINWVKNKEVNALNKGFPVSLKYKTDQLDSHNNLKITSNKQIDICAKCHSRRAQIDDDFVPGDKFDDHYLSSLLEKNLYFADGKIQDEVYVYDSFLQSKMYEKGVKCSDCHNPHTLQRKAEGDKVCFQCHETKKYTSTSHHFHKDSSTGSSCIACHMPARTYMGVDSRNDHSFRIPRPDISVEMKEIPNACNLCHIDKGAKWATAAMKDWYGKIPIGKQNFVHELQALRTNNKEAVKSLYSILISDAPPIAKMTATTYLGNYPSMQTYTTVLQMLKSSDSKMRRAALQALERFPLKMRIKNTLEMLNDPIKTVRMEAARQLSSFSLNEFTSLEKVLVQKAFNEYEKILLFGAERPESQLLLALFYTNIHMNKKAQRAYEEGLSLQPQFVPLYINYSNFLVQNGKNEKAFKLLEKALKKLPNIAILHHSLGLWYVRNKMSVKAVGELKKAANLDKTNPRFSYVYAVSIGEKYPFKAIKILENSYIRFTGDINILSGLVYYTKKVGDSAKSKKYEERLRELQNTSVR